jgi:hypothetical protein
MGVSEPINTDKARQAEPGHEGGPSGSRQAAV